MQKLFKQVLLQQSKQTINKDLIDQNFEKADYLVKNFRKLDAKSVIATKQYLNKLGYANESKNPLSITDKIDDEFEYAINNFKNDLKMFKELSELWKYGTILNHSEYSKIANGFSKYYEAAKLAGGPEEIIGAIDEVRIKLNSYKDNDPVFIISSANLGSQEEVLNKYNINYKKAEKANPKYQGDNYFLYQLNYSELPQKGEVMSYSTSEDRMIITSNYRVKRMELFEEVELPANLKYQEKSVQNNIEKPKQEPKIDQKSEAVTTLPPQVQQGKEDNSCSTDEDFLNKFGKLNKSILEKAKGTFTLDELKDIYKEFNDAKIEDCSILDVKVGNTPVSLTELNKMSKDSRLGNANVKLIPK